MKPVFAIEQRGRATVGYARGKTHEQYEDRFRLLTEDVPVVAEAKRGEIFAVFDGMGSLSQGMHAAQFMADLLIEFFERPDLHASDDRSVEALLLRGSNEIRRWGVDPETGDPVGGCVGTVVWLNRQRAHLFHVGDSEGWLSRSPGEAEKLTECHATGHAVTQFFGRAVEPRVQLVSFAFGPGMRLLLISDGFRHGRVMDVVKASLGERRNGRSTVAAICAAAVLGRAPDDVTALLVVG